MTFVATRSRSELRRILLLGLLVLGIVLAGGLGAVGFAASAVDKAVAAEERKLVSRTIDRQLNKIVEDITSATVWDDAYLRTVTRFDATWANENFGVYYATYMHHNRTLVFGTDDRVIYASDAGEVAPAADLAPFAADVAPLLAGLRREEIRHRSARHGLSAVFTTSALIRSRNEIWLVGLATVIPETAAVSRAAGPTAVVASARRVDATFLKGLEKDLGLTVLRVTTPDARVDHVAVPLLDPTGRVLGRLDWKPHQPGMGILRDVAGPTLLILAAFAVAAGALARRVLAALRSLADNDAKLEAVLTDLTEARDRAEAASVAKSQFLANISHEIRTPLNGVLGMAQIMDRGDLAPTQRGHLAIIRESGATLLTLLNDVLDLAKIEAGKLEIERADLDLTAAVAGACATFTATAQDKGLKLGFALEPSANGAWRLDGLRLNQVLSNLISNAVKFTARGQVSVRVWKSDRGLEFAVRDTGAGVPPERLEDLWGKFHQLDASTTRKFGGSGLGLAICRELVVLMGGDIAAESKVGEGSCFSFFLPAEPGRNRAAAA